MLFIVIASLLLYSRVMNNKSTENRQVKQIESQYSVSNDQLAEAYNDVSSHVTVTFDANGGQVSTSSKEVKRGSAYGNLPTPTRTSYKFKGWNGKNMLGNVQIGIAWNNGNNSNRAVIYAEIKGNTQYTISFDNISNLVDNNSSYSGLHYFTKINKSDTTTIDGPFRITSAESITTASNANYLGIQFNKSDITLNDIKAVKAQLEEGTEATEYEPYFVTSSTKVTQTKDHTLTAIWEEE